MTHYDLEILKKNDNGTYDLFKTTFTNTKKQSYPIKEYKVLIEQEMRIDLVCYQIYKNTDYCDFLLNFNNIKNPLNIMRDDIIYYLDRDLIDYFRVNDTSEEGVKEKLLNINKVSKKDKNREEYVNKNYALPPTVNESPIKQVKIEGNKIVIGDNLFK